MSLAQIPAGTSYPPFTYVIGREAVRDYARATGARDPRLTADPGEVADADVPVPLGFAACFTVAPVIEMILADAGLGVSDGILHGSQDFVRHRPLAVGQRLRCAAEVSDVATRRGTDVLTVRVSCAEATEGQPVLDASSTYFSSTGDAGGSR